MIRIGEIFRDSEELTLMSSFSEFFWGRRRIVAGHGVTNDTSTRDLQERTIGARSAF
jgi:hypothetical protein